MPPPVLPLINEELFISDAIDFNIEHNPNQPFFTYADPDRTDKISVVTHLEFGRAAHRAAHALRPNCSGPDQQVVAIVALSDTIFYQALVAGLSIAGCVPFPISPRNTPAAVVKLLQKTSCQRLITTKVTLDPLLQGIKACIAGTSLAYSLQIEEVPSFEAIYPNLGHESFKHPFERYHLVNRPSKDDICVYIHSSGSTGFPKAIGQSHGAWSQWALFPVVVDFRDYKTSLVLACMALPPFHSFGLYLQLINPLYGLVPIVLYTPTATSPDLLPVTPSSQNILEHSKMNKANGMIITPSILQTWAESPEISEYLKDFEVVMHSGGSLAPKLKQRFIDAGVNLRNIYGGSEFGGPTRVFPLAGDEHDHDYMSFSERAKIRWVSQGDGTFECQFLDWEKHSPLVNNLDDMKGYATSDLFQNHPTKKHLWKIVGRKDDVIVHSTGEKTVPAPIEDVIMSSPIIQASIVFGRGHSQAGVLIVPGHGREIDVNDNAQVVKFRNELWPVIEEANKIAPAYSRIVKEMILIASKDKPLPRTGKGTVMRKAAMDLYAEDIDELYETLESSDNPANSLTPPASWSLNDVEAWIAEQAIDLLPYADTISTTDDLFDQGFDSLGATFLRLRILGVMSASGPREAQKAAAQGLSHNLIYSYPVIRDLAWHIVSICVSSNRSGVDTPSVLKGRDRIETLIKKYTVGLTRAQKALAPQSSPLVVLLTGSTGNLGAEILAALLKDNRVEKVYAFSRLQSHQSPFRRHERRFNDRGLDTSLLEADNLVFLTGDTARLDFDLDPNDYIELHKSVNVVIHNAWKLDFNLSLTAFEPLIRGTRNLVDFIQSGPNASSAYFLFLSSAASAQSWDKSLGPVPEEIVTDAASAVGGGYGESKYVADWVLAKSSLRSTSIRIGQISGGLSNGAWPTTDWVPILVKSSIALGALPRAVGDSHVSWLPADKVAASVVNVALSNDVALPSMLNLVHPKPTKWSEVVMSFQVAVEKVLGYNLRFTSFDDWISAIEAHASNATVETLESIPAVKLLDFFRSFIRKDNSELPYGASNGDANCAEFGGLQTFSTDRTLKANSDLMDANKLRRIVSEDVELWVRYWHGVGFLS